MSVVRELFARLVVDTDRSSFAGANAALGGLEGALGKLGSFASALGIGATLAGAAYAIQSVVKEASAANEVVNVLQQSFEGNTKTVLDWAKTTSTEVGRSEYKLREMASTLGALLTPMLGGATDESARMSTSLSKLAVDMASFFDSSESEALNALRAGIVGESEPLRRFGVLLSEARIQEKALAMGLAKDKKHITDHAKAQARFAIIMEDTARVNGDAARTSDSFANRMRKLEDAGKDLRVTLGDRLLPAAKAVLGVLTSWAFGITEAIKNSAALETVLLALGAAAAYFGTKLLFSNLNVLLWAAAITAAALVLEDWVALLTGKQSVIDDVLTALIGEEKWKAIKGTWIGSMEAIGAGFYDWVHGVEGAWTTAFENMGKAAEPLARMIKQVRDTFVAVGAGWHKTQEKMFAEAGRLIQAQAGGITAQLATPGAAQGQYVTAPGGRTATTTVTGSPIVVNVNGSADRGTAHEIGRVVRRELDAQAGKVARTASSTEAR